MIRFTITFRVRSGDFLPFNHQAAVSAWLYHTIGEADTQYAAALHDLGYGKRGFKLFTFSNLIPDKAKPDEEAGALKLLSDRITLTVCFISPVASEAFLNGTFMRRQFILRTDGRKLIGDVVNVRPEPTPTFNRTMTYEALNPICIVEPEMKGNKLRQNYIPPDHPSYTELFERNLIKQSETAALIMNEPFGSDESSTTGLSTVFSNRFKSKLITVKNKTDINIKIKGYLCSFVLSAPEFVHQVGYFSGFGEKNSQGFGLCRIKKNDL